MKLQVFSTADGFDALRVEWDNLLSVSATNEVFLTYEWQSTWWNTYCPGDLWLIAGRDDEGHLVGIAPWFVEQPSRFVRMVGCVDVTDYLDLVAAPEHLSAFCVALADWLKEHARQFESLSLCNIPTQSPTLTALSHALTGSGFAVEIEQQEVCPAIRLPATFEAYLESLDKKQRHELRRKLRRAENAEGDKVAWYIADPGLDEYEWANQVECFLELMAASHPDKKHFLEDERNVTFFRAVAPVLAARGWLQLSFLTVNGESAASYFAVDYGNRIGLYNSGLKPEAYAYLSPGIVLLTYIIRYAIEQGHTVFDFLRGNEEYKYRMGAQDSRVMELRARYSV